MSTQICWIDLETTGLRLEDSKILEVGIALTDEEGEIQAEKSWLNPAPLDGLRVAALDPVVLAMHAASGLWADLQRQYQDPLRDPLTLRPARGLDLNQEVAQWISLNTNWTTKRIPLAGSGVSHFDRQFIRRDLPDVDRKLTYWAYDVGVMRRMLRLIGFNSQTDEAQPTHRALDDVKAHIKEFQTQLALLRTIDFPRVSTGVQLDPLFPSRETTELTEGAPA